MSASAQAPTTGGTIGTSPDSSRRFSSRVMNPLLQTLAQQGRIDATDIHKIEQAVTAEKDLEAVLIEHGVTVANILAAKGEAFGLPTIDLSSVEIPAETIKLIPAKSIERYLVLPIRVKDGVLEVGFVDPGDLSARDAVQFIASKNGMPFRAVVITKTDFDQARSSIDGLSGEVGKALTDLETDLSAEEQELSDKIKKAQAGDEEEEPTKIVEDAPVTKIVATILRYATEGGASDVHIEPTDTKIRVRFRIDGTLHTSLMLPIGVLPQVVARIKILSNMKLDEKRKPQDGRFSAHIDSRKIDFRVSTFPTYYGEKVVMRILDSEKGVKPLDSLGLSERNLELIRDAVKQPYGMVLISGPTGSGKTTTLYSMLNEVDREGKNVLSLEDPVEYNVAGMNQSQIRPEIGYTFANGLRTTLRQDPDIIMVGEIRDTETAQLAIQAALTGHLVLSTIHTNNAVGVIPRLIDMGVDPYLIAPTLILAIGQRLVKKLCPGAGREIPVEGSVAIMIEREFADLPEEYRNKITVPEYVYGIAPSADCPNGTSGRQAVFEVMPMSKGIEQVILKDPNEIDLFNEARKGGMMTIREDALVKAFDHVVPFEEVNKL
jgi:type IV pilus assembly protein PilB